MRPTTPNSPITALEADPRREGAVRLIVGGHAVLTLPVEVVAAEGLRPGAVLGAEQLVRLERAADEEAALRTAVRLLARRPLARADLGRRLRLKGHPAEAVVAALDRAERLGYLDDARFARHYVESRAMRGRGPARLRRELAQMGVARPLIDASLAAEGAEHDIGEQIDRLLSRRLPLVRGLPPAAARQRLLAYLARRGFQGEAVRAKVLAALAGKRA